MGFEKGRTYCKLVIIKIAVQGKDWDTEIDLTELGDDGSELVSALPVVRWNGQFPGTTDHLVYYFKRPKE